MLGGVEEDIKVDEGNACLTNPEEAVESSSSRAATRSPPPSAPATVRYKFKGQQSLHFEVLEAIQQKIPGFPIVMHGSSSVPVDEVMRINKAGGTLDPTARGVNENEYLPAPSSASPRSTSTPTAASSGPASIANTSAITPSPSTSARRQDLH